MLQSRSRGPPSSSSSGTDYTVDGCHCTVRYAIDTPRSEHEQWLLEWSIDAIGSPAIDNVDVDRSTQVDAGRYTVNLDLETDCESFERGRAFELVERLDRRATTAEVKLWIGERVVETDPRSPSRL